MNKNLLSIITLILTLSIGGYLIYSNNNQEKRAFVLNKKLFDGFKGKQYLETKLTEVRKVHKHTLDSIASIIESDSKNTVLINNYQATSRTYEMDEQQLSDKYTAEIWRQINASLTEFGKENKYDFIYGATGDGNLMYANEAFDITDEAIVYVNARYEGNK